MSVELVVLASFFMHFRIACGVTIAAVAFAIASAVGGKIPYEVTLTALLAVLTYWSQAPTQSTRLSRVEESDGEH
jgi:membrane protein implicated in regulation of membrane protease activity